MPSAKVGFPGRGLLKTKAKKKKLNISSFKKKRQKHIEWTGLCLVHRWVGFTSESDQLMRKTRGPEQGLHASPLCAEGTGQHFSQA